MKARENALQILIKNEENQAYANLELKKKIKVTDPREKALVTELVYGSLRYRLRLDYIIRKFSKVPLRKINPNIKNVLRLSIYQIIFLDKIPDSAACNEGTSLALKYGGKGASSYVNGVLRSVSREKNNIKYPNNEVENLMYYYSFPESIVKIMLRDYSYNGAKKILNALNMNKGICVRPNLLKTTVADFEKLIEGYEYEKGDECYYMKGFSVTDNSLYDEGIYTVQDRASMMSAELLAPEKGERVLDLCAAPGGKSCYMAQLMENQGEIISCDIHEHRCELIDKNALRLGVDIIKTVVNDASIEKEEFKDGFDKVLIDAPCSGLGVIAKKPDIKWSEKDFDSLTALQYNILEKGSMYVKKGGKLVYSTCTINKDENEHIVEKFLENNKNFNKVSEFIQLMPGFKTDGFFMCRLERIY